MSESPTELTSCGPYIEHPVGQLIPLLFSVALKRVIISGQQYSLLRKRVSASRCLATDVSAVLFWLHISGFQASCHSMLYVSNWIILTKFCEVLRHRKTAETYIEIGYLRLTETKHITIGFGKSNTSAIQYNAEYYLIIVYRISHQTSIPLLPSRAGIMQSVWRLRYGVKNRRMASGNPAGAETFFSSPHSTNRLRVPT
jgi:hypothetical protein